MSGTELYFNNAPPEQGTIPEYYQFRTQHQDLALREPTAGKRGERHPTEKRHRDFEEAIPDDRAKRKAGIYRGEDDRNNKILVVINSARHEMITKSRMNALWERNWEQS
ncbi:hypothetical protein BC937DRAFT_94408 [Endogone sp. FLAS-F59071]|nr:hypothetical protein BC937DRAFT_94408 [Endogone sp. FLAS-F59071]|eukprot:RUS14062.1 hypothetical protein BC937DRAFT_94408 [Endogone sp. FLAS-F59071]